MKTSFKKIVVVAAVICVLFAMFALAASATDVSVPTSGSVTSGSNSYAWNYDESSFTLTIDGVDNAWSWDLETLAGDETYTLFTDTYGASVKTVVITGNVRKMTKNFTVLRCPNVETVNFSSCARFQQAASFFGGLTKLKVVNFLGSTSDCVDLSNVGTMNELANTFKGCTSIEKVIMPVKSFMTNNGNSGDECPYIFTGMFEGCTSLSDIEIPGWVTEIKARAFKDCTSLTKLVIPASVTAIADDAFEGCTLTIMGEEGSYAETYANEKGIAFEIYDPSTPWARVNSKDGQDDLVWKFNPATGVLTVKSETTTSLSYDLDQDWNKKANQSAIPWFADYKTSITDIVIDGAVKELTQYSFCDLPNLKTVTLSKNVSIIRTNTFASDAKLESVTVAGNAHVKGVYDLTNIAYGNGEIFQAVGKGLDIKIYTSPSKSHTSVSVGVIAVEAKSVTFYVLAGTNSETAADKMIANAGASRYCKNISKEYYTWEELKTLAPLSADAVVSGTFSGTYCDGTWNFDIETGVFEMNSTKSGWCQFEFNGALKTAWPVFKMYVKEMRFTGTGVKIWADGNYDFSSMPYLEKISTEKNATTGKEMVGEIQLGASSGLANNVSLKTLGSTDGVVDLTIFSSKYSTKFTNCTGIEQIKISEKNTMFTSGMFDGCTGLKSVKFIGTNCAALGSSDALLFAEDVRIDVESTEVKEAVEALGYTNVHAPAGAVRRGMVFDGYQLRNAGYNGLRSVFTFNLTEAQANNPDYTLVEYGSILAASSAKNAYGTALTQDGEGNWVTANAKVFKMAVGDSTGIINTVLDSSTDDVTRFCVAVVKYTKNYDTPLYNTGYEIWQNNETGEYSVVYTDYNTGLESESEWAETSIYAVTLGRIKDGLEDPNNEIHWGVLAGKGAVTFTKGTDYDDTWTDMNGEAFGETFTFLDVQVADSGKGSTAGYGKISIFEDKNGAYVMIFKDGMAFSSDWNKGNQICKCFYDNLDDPTKSQTYFFKNQKAPNPHFANSVIWDKIDAIVLADGVNVGIYGFKDTKATQLTYAPGASGFARAFSSAASLSSVFPSNYGGAVSNKAVGTFDMSETSVTEFSETFNTCSAVKYIRLPNSVTKISDKAFRSCGALLSVVTGDNEFVESVMDFRDSSLRTIALGNTANHQIYNGNKINTVYLPALADGETFTIAAGTFSTAINFRQATFSQAVYDFVANSGVEGMTYTDINGNVWDSASTDSYESMAGWSNIIVD